MAVAFTIYIDQDKEGMTYPLKGFTPGTAWDAFNENWQTLDAYYNNKLFTTAVDGRGIPIAPVARLGFSFDLIKKAADEITEDSIYVDVLAAWEDDILNWSSDPIPYPSQPASNSEWNASTQMIGNGLTFGEYARKVGTKFLVKVPSVTSATGKSGTSGHIDFGPFVYDDDDLIRPQTGDPDYVLAYEEVSGEFIDLDQAASNEYTRHNGGDLQSASGQGLPGQRWDGLKVSGSGITYDVNAYNYSAGINASGVDVYLSEIWSTGDQPDFFKELATTRPPGYLTARTLGQDLYNATMLYREAIERHLDTTSLDRFEAMAVSVSNDLQVKDDQLTALQDKINSGADGSVLATLDEQASLREAQIFPDLHLSNDYIISAGEFRDFTIQGAIDFVNKRTEIHEDNNIYAQITLVDGTLVANGLIEVVGASPSGECYRGSNLIGNVGLDSEGNAVVAGTYSSFPIDDNKMYLEIPKPNPHGVDSSVVGGVITYTASV